VPHFDASSAECLVLTFKEGLLSAVAHDLRVHVTRFEVDVDGSPLSVRGRFQASSLRVEGAVHDGTLQPGQLSDADKQKIEHNIVAEVLHAEAHPEVTFASTSVTPEGDGFRVASDLTLHGRSRPITIMARPDGDRIQAEVSIHQPDFGIKPYSAMLGAIKIRPDVVVRVTLPRAGLPVS
jgi:polyisoprenoid-binding protein YceI